MTSAYYKREDVMVLLELELAEPCKQDTCLLLNNPGFILDNGNILR